MILNCEGAIIFNVILNNDWLVVTLENKMLLKLYFILKKGHYMHIYIQKGIPREANK